ATGSYALALGRDTKPGYHALVVSSSTGLGIEGYLTYWKDELRNHTLGTKAQNMHQLRVFGAKKQALYFSPLPSTSCQWYLCFGTRPRHQTRAPWLGRPDSRRQNLIFFTNCNILHTLKKEPLNIMLLHTIRTMDGPRIKTVPVVSRSFDVSSSTGLGIEGCRTCWKDELGNHSLGMKAQNMHQLRIL